MEEFSSIVNSSTGNLTVHNHGWSPSTRTRTSLVYLFFKKAKKMYSRLY